MEGLQITKRDGTKDAYDTTKIRAVVKWACEGMNVNPIALEAGLTTRLRAGITTREIQENLIHCAVEMCSLDEPDWRYVAGRMHIWSLWKDALVSRGYQYGEYAKAVRTKVEAGQYDARLLNYSAAELREAGDWIVPDRDLDYDYAGAVLLTSRYLLKDELPQEAILACALLLALPEKPENRMKWARRFYDAISQRQISLATPILANLRVPNGSLSSCFIMSVDDTLESIYQALTNAAQISKNGGGIGVNVSRIRAMGSDVMGKANASGGVIPWIKLFNDTALAVNQGGKRAGAITVSLDVWHLDVPEFLEMQAENGDRRRKAYDIFPQLVITDEFMRRVDNKEDWTLIDPHEVKEKLGIDLAASWGLSFDIAYRAIESAVEEGTLTLYNKVNARHLFKEIMRAQVETGMPYLAFKDTINRANPNSHTGYIPGVNLCCVVGETLILTSKGYAKIESLAGQSVELWNGEKWSLSPVFQTSDGQPVIKLDFSNGQDIEVTNYHHFWIQDSYRAKPRKIEAKDITVGDKLVKFDLPVIDSPDSPDWQYAYTHGFYCGDGSNGGRDKTVAEIDLYHEKQDLLPFIDVRRHIGKKVSTEIQAVYVDTKQNRTVCKLPSDMSAKFEVPTAEYSLQSRLDWFAGLCDADGCAVFNGESQGIQVTSIHLGFLKETQLMLQTCGIHTKISPSQEAGTRQLPNGKGQLADYFCQKGYRLLVPGTSLYALQQLGFKTNRLRFTAHKPQRNAQRFVTVTAIKDEKKNAPTYCFTEPERNMGVFNGILAGNCESYSNVKPGEEIHCCNLVSLNLAVLPTEQPEIEDLCWTAVRILDNTIDLTNPPVTEAGTHNDKYRTIGVGMMGLADWLAKNNLNYRAIPNISGLFERLGYYCTAASVDLARERGAYPAYAGSGWSKGLMIGNKTVDTLKEQGELGEKWDVLARNLAQYGVRNSHITAIAPNTSSALVNGCTASILPAFSRFFVDKGSKGAVPVAPPYVADKFWFYQENKTLDQNAVIEATATIQKWIDTGISMELLFNLNEGVYHEGNFTAKDMYDCLLTAWRDGVKAVYYVRTVQKDGFKDSDGGCTSCAN